MSLLLLVIRGAMAVATVAAIVTQFVLGTERPDGSAVNLFSSFTFRSNVAALTVLEGGRPAPGLARRRGGAPVRAAASAPGADPRP